MIYLDSNVFIYAPCSLLSDLRLRDDQYLDGSGAVGPDEKQGIHPRRDYCDHNGHEKALSWFIYEALQFGRESISRGPQPRTSRAGNFIKNL